MWHNSRKRLIGLEKDTNKGDFRKAVIQGCRQERYDAKCDWWARWRVSFQGLPFLIFVAVINSLIVSFQILVIHLLLFTNAVAV